ncbi:MAG: hypothetical protein ACYDEA_05600 [Candidatus Dormibacteria bacterium]
MTEALTESASQRRRAEGARNDALVLGALAAAGDAGLSPRELACRAELTPGTTRAAVRRLVARRLAVRDGKRGPVRATIAGRTQAGAGTSGVALTSALESAIGQFPAEAQRAFLRLLLSGIVARRHLAQDYPQGWGGFICTGPTQTGKTSLAAFACRVFGIGPEAVRVLRDETPGSIFARRQQGQGSAWTADRSPLLGLPFLCIDEYDKAPEEVRRAAARLLQGQTVVDVEGVGFPVSPVPMVVLNARPHELAQQLHEAYLRRSPVLDTGELGGLLRDIDEDMRKLFNGPVIPRLDLDALRPPSSIADADRARLRSALRSGLTEEGWRLADVEAISRLALGRIPLMGAAPDPGQASLSTALDYLICASTVRGHVQPGAIGELRGQLGGDVPMAANVEAHAAQQAVLVRHEQDRTVAKLADGAAFVADRAELAAKLTGLVDRLGRRRDPEASAVRAALRKLATDAHGCRSREGLETVDAAALPFGERAKVLLDRWAAEARRADQVKLDAAARRQQALWNKRQTAQRRQQEQREARARAAANAKNRRAWMATLRALYRISPFDSLRIALDGLVRTGWLEVGSQYRGHRVKFGDVPGWPPGTVVDERDGGQFWGAACAHAERQAGRNSSQRPAWRSKWEVEQERENARYLQKLGL